MKMVQGDVDLRGKKVGVTNINFFLLNLSTCCVNDVPGVSEAFEVVHYLSNTTSINDATFFPHPRRSTLVLSPRIINKTSITS